MTATAVAQHLRVTSEAVAWKERALINVTVARLSRGSLHSSLTCAEGSAVRLHRADRVLETNSNETPRDGATWRSSRSAMLAFFCLCWSLLFAGCGASFTNNSSATAPTVTIAANPGTITSGSSSTLTVTAANAAQVTVTGSNGSTYTLQATGGTQSVSPTTTTTYTATATGAGGKSTATATVTVGSSPAPTVKITASPTSITSGSSFNLDRDCSQRHPSDSHRDRRQHIHPAAGRRNAKCHSDRDHNLHRHRYGSRRENLRHCNRDRAAACGRTHSQHDCQTHIDCFRCFVHC